MNRFRRYKSGFERIGIVMFVIVGVAISLLHIIAETGYEAPQDLEDKIEVSCGPPGKYPTAYLCREAARANLRWHHYTDKMDSPTYFTIAFLLLTIAIIFAGRWTISWIRKGIQENTEKNND